MKLHELKSENPYFNDVWLGNKTFEIRLNDRGYKEGDLLYLREYCKTGFPITFDIVAARDGNELTTIYKVLPNGQRDPYSGRAVLADVCYILTDFAGLAPGYVAMGIEILSTRDEKEGCACGCGH